MKNKILVITISLINFCSFSQNIEFTLSQTEHKDTKNFKFADSQAFYTSDFYEYQTTSFYLSKYSSIDLKNIYATKINMPKINNKETKSLELLLIENDLVLFSTLFDKKTNKFILYATKINADGILSIESKVVSEIDAYKKSYGYFIVRLTESKKTIIINTEKPSNETDSVRYNWKIIDKNCNILRDKSLSLPYYGNESWPVKLMEYKYDKIYFLATNLKKLPVKDQIKAPIENKLYCYDLKNEKITDYPLSIETRSLFDLHINFNTENQVILTGLYSYSDINEKCVFYDNDRPDLRRGAGALCEILNENLELNLYKNYIDFPKKKTDFTPIFLKDIYLQDDGSIILISEFKYNVGSFTTITFGSNSGSSDRHFGDILINTFDPLSKAHYVNRVSKDQIQRLEGILSSYVSISNGKKIELFVSDTDDKKLTKNINTNSEFYINNSKSYKHSKTLLLEIDNKGNMKENTDVKELINREFLMMCDYKISLNQNEIIFSYENNSGQKFGKMLYKK